MAVVTLPTQDEERRLRAAGFPRVAGVDEAGRGPLAGPVVAGAVVLPDLTASAAAELLLIRDSKMLSASQRRRAAALIHSLTDDIGIGVASVDEIDEHGIAPATKLAMRRALSGLRLPPDHLLVDAVRLDWNRLPCLALVRGDSLCTAIAAASIVAKVHRDALMDELDAVHPGYGFARHKGYAAPSHLEALARLGPSPAHRRSFAPLRLALPHADA
ncbi:MAG: ribonuclease HII [SAR202 cluster bacterium]|nr:ribonuclease HII [SAR202 cluster bacterium]